MKALGFLAVGVAALLIYAGWLGVPPGRLVGDLLSGEQLPTRKPLTGQGSDIDAADYTTPMPSTGATGTYPLSQGTVSA